jgi:hypothetical protein
MIKLTYTLLSLILLFSCHQLFAEENISEEKKITTINLKYITGEDVLSVLKSLVDKSVSISQGNGVLLINGTPSKTKNILHIIKKIDTPPDILTIEFIASNSKINFNKTSKTYRAGKNRANTSQSMSITERQWVKLNTGISIPVTERKRYADGTETQSFTFKKISKSYIFKVHEFSGWSVIQVGLNASSLSDDIAGAIVHTQLDTTIVGKTNEWLEVASSKPVSEDENTKTYSTSSRNKKFIHLYVKVNKPKSIIESEPEKTQ